MACDIFSGGVFRDGRGALRYCNGADLSGVRRFYTVANAASAPVRGWIVHLRERKWFFPLSGVTVLHTAPCPDPVGAGLDLSRKQSVRLEASAPSVLSVPPGTALAIEQNGDAEVLVFSDRTADESAADVWRFPYI